MEPVYYVSTILIAGLTLYLYAKWCFSYWKKKNVVYFEPTFPFGNHKNPIASRESQTVQMRSFYNRLKSVGAKYGGYYSFLSPVFVPIDPEHIRCILSSDFQHFQARGFYHNEKEQPISAHLFSLDGTKWKNLRAKFTPTFSSNKVKQMCQLLIDCSDVMKQTITLGIAENKPINMKHIATCCTLDQIASCAFGVELNCLVDTDNDFYKYTNIGLVEIAAPVKGVFCFSFASLAKMLKIVTFSRDVENFMNKAIRDIVSHREVNNIRRNDFLQILIDLKNGQQETKEECLTLNEITGQSFVFLLAGFETSATTISYCIFELAQNKYIQQKARAEVNAIMAKHGGRITYDSLQDMKYLQQVVDETLRKYPVGGLLYRQCTADYMVPGTDILIEKGTNLIIPVMGLHRDSEYYPEPEKFDPERFSSENVRARHAYAYLPFGAGPRNCIAVRFGLLQVKLAVAVILSNFNFTLNRNTEVPLKFATSTFLLRPLGDILVDMEVITK